jgi:hypothetical protein
MENIYSPHHYYQRVKTFLKEYQPPSIRAPFNWTQMMAFFRSIYRLGIVGEERKEYWDLLLWTLKKRPALFSTAVTMAIYGHHFKKISEKHIF